MPPRPAKRIHNPDGTITDPEIEKFRAEAKEAAKKAKEEARAAKLAAETENSAAEKTAEEQK